MREAGRYAAAIYLSGYAVELALKARICETLGWSWFPSRTAEFTDYRSLQTHDLNVLLEFSGIKSGINAEWTAAWKIVANWKSEWRYLPTETANRDTCSQMLASVDVLLEVI